MPEPPNTPVDLPPLRTESLFSIPVWRSRVPAFFAHHAEVRETLLRAWRAGEFPRHRHGYGYQSPATLFYADTLERLPALALLRQAFIQNVESIVRRRVGLATSMPFRVSAVMGWVLFQTAEEWVSGTWHDHYPALVSGCYYLSVPDTERDEEGALAFQRPGSQDLFVEHIQRIRPREGDFILFPSSLYHRPEPCPSAGDAVRISINMDAYVDWIHQDELERGEMGREEFEDLLRGSLAEDR